MHEKKVVIIIPTYNESDVIANTLHELIKHTHCIIDKQIAILIFDSHSTDNTAAIIKDLQQSLPQIHLLEEPKKSGLGSAYHQAMHYAIQTMQADIIVEFDADLSHQPQYLPDMLEKIDHYDVVLGSRYVNGGSIPSNWGWHRKLLSKWGNTIARLALTRKIHDFTSGFRATRADALKAALPQQFISNGYAYKIELLWKLYQLGALIFEYPIDFIDRQQGVSKLPSNSILDSLYVLARLRGYKYFRYFKMCLVGFSSMLIQYAIYNCLRKVLPPFQAIQIAVSCAVVNNFTLNTKFTFKYKDKYNKSSLLRSLMLYVGYSVLMLYFQAYWLKLWVQIIGEGLLQENLIMFAGIVLCSILNYFIYSRFIWKPTKISSQQQTANLL